MIRYVGITLALLIGFSTQADAHSGGLNKQGCHAGSKPYHCHSATKKAVKDPSSPSTLNGTVTHVSYGDTLAVNGVAVRLSALMSSPT